MDIISYLPDSLKLHILSFLEMKQVVQTCCLSKKWIDLWKSVPVLKFDFDYIRHGYTSSYENKVMNILRCVLDRRDDSKIQKLELSGLWFSDGISKPSTLTRFLGVALQRHIKEVHLRSSSEIYCKLPHCLFTSSVKVFKLHHIYRSSNLALKLPNSIFTATQFTTLELKHVRLIPGDSNGELILSCPVLEILSLKYCPNHRDLQMLNISAVRLKRLKIYGYWCDDYTKHHKIKICTPNLTSIDLFDPFYDDFYLEDLPSLVSANIQLNFHTLSMECVNGILNQLNNVTALKLNIRYLGVKIFPWSGGMLNQLQNPFSNLRKLSLKKICGRGIQLVQSLLNLSPYILKLLS